MPYPWPTLRGIVQIGGVSVETVAQAFDTPCYVTDRAVVQERYRALRAALAAYQPAHIAYACKANTNLALLRLLTNEGCAIDAVSPGEVTAALTIGVAPDRIMFTGTNPRDDELEWLRAQNIWINIDALSVAKRIAPRCAPRAFSARVNPGIGAGHHEHVVTGGETQFGLRPDDLPECLDLLQANGHRLARLHAHIGSGIMGADSYVALIDLLHQMAKDIAPHPAATIEAVDIGGGFGIPYRPEEDPLDLPMVIAAIGKRFRHCFGRSITLMVEPGRYLVGDSTILLTRVTTIKRTPHTIFLGCDAGLNTLLRPAFYQAYHHIAAATKCDLPATHRYTVCGPICETGDVLGASCSLPAMAEGDLLAIYDTGAYGYAMASNYNSRPRPAEVMVSDGTMHLTRRRETFDDLLAGQTIPESFK